MIVNFEDLLGTSVSDMDMSKVKSMLINKTVMVTGAGGSIGSELCSQIASYGASSIIMVDMNESNLYYSVAAVKKVSLSILVCPVLLNITDNIALYRLFSKHKPFLVIHAAAYKHLPMVEMNAMESIFNNIVSSYNVAVTSSYFDIPHSVLISTDKAVNPSSIMGLTKRISEMIFKYFNIHSAGSFSSVRFGNVLCSSGSVVPLFMNQAKQGGPVTVTHKDVTRYFMSLSEAVSLVLISYTIECSSRLFILDMGEPIKLSDIAHSVIENMGGNIKIEYIGLRGGEKMHEELWESSDTISSPDENKIIRCTNNDSMHQTSIGYEFTIYEFMDHLRHNLRHDNMSEVLKLLSSVVPTYNKSPIISTRL